MIYDLIANNRKQAVDYAVCHDFENEQELIEDPQDPRMTAYVETRRNIEIWFNHPGNYYFFKPCREIS